LLTQDASVHRASSDTHANSLKLLRHFDLETVKTTAFGTEAQTAWCRAVPQLAYHHDFVLHGIMSLAALHLSRLANSREEREHYQSKAAVELSTGLSHYKVEIQKVTAENAEALFAFSTVITGHYLLNARIECENLLESMYAIGRNSGLAQKIVHDLAQTVVKVLRCLRGVLVILVPGWNQIHSGPLRPVIERENWPPTTPETDDEKDQDQRLRKLEHMWMSTEKGYQYHFDTYRHVLRSLRESFLLVSRVSKEAPLQDTASEMTSFDWTSVFHWPVQCPVDFLLLLEKGHMEAWVFIAHHAMLLAQVKGVWWLDGLAASFAMTAALMIGRENWGWIAWPLASIDVDMEALQRLATIHENARSERTKDAPQPSAE
jgi:hypothetical protein